MGKVLKPPNPKSPKLLQSRICVHYEFSRLCFSFPAYSPSSGFQLLLGNKFFATLVFIKKRKKKTKKNNKTKPKNHNKKTHTKHTQVHSNQTEN